MSTYRHRDADYLLPGDNRSARTMTEQERGVLALLKGLDTYTRLCAAHYADECAAREMGMGDLFQTARAMLAYAPDTLRRGAIDSAYAELMDAWHIHPDTLAYYPPEQGDDQ